MTADAARKLIVIVEDDDVAAEIFARILDEAGYDAKVAGDVAPALALLQSTSAAAVLIDLRLPTASGVDLLRKLRSEPSLEATPAVIVTGDYLIDDLTMENIRALGADVYFKPMWAPELVALVTTLAAKGGAPPAAG